MTPEAKARYEQKMRRIGGALDHREPDRVPIHVSGEIYAVMEAGYTIKECIYDKTMRKAKEAAERFMLTYDVDFGVSLCNYAGEGEYMELVSPKYMAWSGRPGYKLEDNSIQQFIEHPTLHDEDIDQFFDDNGTWRLTKCQPNMCDLYEPLRAFTIPYSTRTPTALAEAFSKPEIRAMLEKCWKLTDLVNEARRTRAGVMAELRELGFPYTMGGKACVPYDEWGDEYRGSLDCLTDLYENPEAIERFIAADQEKMLAEIRSWNQDGSLDGKTVMMTLHRGMDGFLSDEFYRDIYWKHLQQIIEAIMSRNMVPDVFCEGNYVTRLDLLRDIPRGRIIYTFEYTPLDLAKKKLGDVATICGGLRSASLMYDSRQKVIDDVKKCIDDAGAGGGYIFRTSAGIDFAKKENVEAMFDTLYTYGAKASC